MDFKAKAEYISCDHCIPEKIEKALLEAYTAGQKAAYEDAGKIVCSKCRDNVLLCGVPGTYRHETTGNDKCAAEKIYLARDYSLQRRRVR